MTAARDDWQVRGRQGDPYLGVYTLSQFVYCPRAGLIQHEKNQIEPSDDDQESREAEQIDAMVRSLRVSPLRRFYATQYQIQRDLNERLSAIHPRMMAAAKAGGLLCGLAVIVWLVASRIIMPGTSPPHWAVAVFVAALIGAALCLGWLKSAFGEMMRLQRDTRVLQRLLRAAESTPSSDPGNNPEDLAEVSWWGLQNAGYEPIIPQDPMSDDATGLAGKPWRILRRGSLRIPVILKRRSQGKNPRGVYLNHRVRLAAYSHLIEECEGGHSPYGVIVFTDDYSGIIVRTDGDAKRRLSSSVRRARDTILNSTQRGIDPNPPQSDAVCANCHLGKPFRLGGVAPSGLVKLNVPAFPQLADDDYEYHSECGDRFCWIPPHSKAIDKGLI